MEKQWLEQTSRNELLATKLEMVFIHELTFNRMKFY